MTGIRRQMQVWELKNKKNEKGKNGYIVEARAARLLVVHDWGYFSSFFESERAPRPISSHALPTTSAPSFLLRMMKLYTAKGLIKEGSALLLPLGDILRVKMMARWNI